VVKVAKIIVNAKDGRREYYNAGYDFSNRTLKIWYGKSKGKKGAPPNKTYKLSELKKVNGKYFYTE
jgi:hypothetical protein